MVQVYKLHDTQPSGAIRINPKDAGEWNKQGFGIFWTVNSFKGARRIENLQKLNAWAIDMDEGEKPEMLERIKSGLVPSMVIETKRGYHVYFAAKNADPHHWNSIVLDRLVPFYGADPKARDMARILRMPGYYHMKDPANPFMVEKVWEWPVSYSEAQMALFYPDKSKDEREAFVAKQKQDFGQGDFWEKVWRIDCHEFLTRISGHELVGGETYDFKPTSKGNLNIWVNGKSSSCWIDRDNRIGSFDKGGPTCANWLRWFGHDWKKIIDSLKGLYPELVCNRQN